MDYDKDFRDLYLSTRYGMIHYKHHPGSSSSMIMIHGLASSTRTWRRLVEHLPEGLDVYLIDLLGHAESDAPEMKYTVNIQVEIVRELVSENRITLPYLFGHSYGGWVSALYARDNPTRGVILEDSAGLEQFYSEVRGTEARKKYKEDILKKALALDARRHVIEAVLNDEFLESQLEEKDLKAIGVPVLIIWGSEDNVVDPKYARIFNSEIKNSRLSVIQGAKHTPHYTNSKEVADLLLGFMGS